MDLFGGQEGMVWEVVNRLAYAMERRDAVLKGHNASFAGNSGGEFTYRIASENGVGEVRHRCVIPGIELMFNDYRMENYTSNVSGTGASLVLDYCREGRLEFRTKDGQSGFFESGDVSLDRRDSHAGLYEFPLKRYSGISIGIDLKSISCDFPEVARSLPVDAARLQERLTNPGARTIIKGNTSLQRILDGFYDVPENISQAYFLIKVQEVLVYLETVDVAESSDKRKYFSRAHVEKVKAMHAFMVADLSRHYTIRELADTFELSLSALKSCFKGVYGDSVYSYMRSYRVNRAAEMISENPGLSISSVAAAVGYANPSKFSDAFRGVMGCLPSEYRVEMKHSKERRSVWS